MPLKLLLNSPSHPMSINAYPCPLEEATI